MIKYRERTIGQISLYFIFISQYCNSFVISKISIAPFITLTTERVNLKFQYFSIFHSMYEAE